MNSWIGITLFVLGLALAGACSQGQADQHQGRQPGQHQEQQVSDGRAAVTVDGDGYHPAKLHAPAGQALTIAFTRTSDRTCGTELVFPSLNIRKNLPLNQAVEVTITPAAGTTNFTCGMGMYQGSIMAH